MPAQVTLNSLLNKTQRFPRFCYGKNTIKGEDIYVDVKFKAKCRGLCPCCMKPCPTYDTQALRVWLFLIFWGFMIKLRYASRRIECPVHGIKVEHLPWSHGKSPVSISMMSFLSRWARHLPWNVLAQMYHLDWRKVYESVKWSVEQGLAKRDLSNITAIGVDEIAWAKGKKAESFATVVYQINKGSRRLLCVEKTRSSKALRKALGSLDTPVLQQINVVCSDMCKSFLKVIREDLPQALNILDRFHICAHLNDAVDKIRRSEVASMGKSTKAKILKNMRWNLLKKGSRVRGHAKIRLNTLIKSKSKTARGWILKEAFEQFWAYNSVGYAMRFLNAWCTRAMRSRLKPMANVAQMLRRHEPLLRNWFTMKKEFSNAVTEGFNGKIRVITKRAYGYKSFEVLRIALFHSLGDLPEPPPPHRFC
jgi:transposase